ncbi:MAG: MBL fold metallo-hydrolase [Candidatus Acidiferrales bacterium]|jgi:ribonuclease J
MFASAPLVQEQTITVAIHRGSNEIGGNCVEIATTKSRLILDVGMPLSEMMDDGTSRRRKPDRVDLIRRGVIKHIPGLFSVGPKIDGILLSHAHGDHFGLIEYTRPRIPVYLSRGASKMLMSGALFAGQSELPRERQKVLLPGKPRRIGEFLVTAYLVDHSSFGSLAFLIESGGKRIVYSGDLRLHGRKPGMAEDLLKAIRKAPLDLLIMEGTSLSRGQEPGLSEQDVETLLVNSLKQTPGLALAMFSPQNADRLVSYYRAAVRTDRTLVLDPYAAFILYLIKSECKVPDPFQGKHMRIFVAESFLRSMAGRRLQKLIPRMKKVEVSRAEILAAPRNFLMIFREWMYERIFETKLPAGSRLFYSYWPGYLDTQPRLKELRAQLEKSGCGFDLVHASGHIYYQDIMEFIERVDPIKIMPIHTTAAVELEKIFFTRIVRESCWEVK